MNTKTVAFQLADENAQKILEKLGLSESAPKMQAQSLAKVGELLLKRISLEILKKLPDSEIPIFDELMESGSPEAWKAFLDPIIGDSEAFVAGVIAEEVEELRKEMLL